jgi:DNA-binding response OmpR family regulator
MIAGADKDTVNGLATHLTDCGHRSKFVRDGVECMAALRGFMPDLLLLEFDLLWGGCDGVMAVMNDDPQLENIPVVLFAERYKQTETQEQPRIIATLAHPFHPRDLSSLNDLLRSMSARRIDDSVSAHRNGQSHSNGETATPRNSVVARSATKD